MNGHPRTLYVAPTREGGFCELWSGIDGGCRSTRSTHIGVTASLRLSKSGVPLLTQLDGSFFQAGVARVEISFADGTHTQTPFVWITAPIDAGFYIYDVPDANQTPAHRPTSVAIYSQANKLLARTALTIPNVNPQVHYRLPGYPPLGVPRQAIWARRRLLFDFRIAKGFRVGLWIAPERGGGTCYWTNRTYGCTRNPTPIPQRVPHRRGARTRGLIQLGLLGGENPVILCQVAKTVAHVQLQYQDGARTQLTPKQTYLLALIPRRHFAPGYRLDRIVAYNSAGRAIASVPIRTTTMGVYPCSKPKKLGYGVSECS